MFCSDAAAEESVPACQMADGVAQFSTGDHPLLCVAAVNAFSSLMLLFGW